MKRSGPAALVGSCVSIFWPGALVFGLCGVLGPYWQTAFQVGKGAVGTTLFFVLAATGVFMFLTGRRQEKEGPTPLAAIGITLSAVSTILLGKASDIWHVYLWAFVVGGSSSLVYIPTLTVVQRWYPQRRGLVSGLVSLAFGFSAAVMSPLFSSSMIRLGYPSTTLLFGVIALIVGSAAVPFVALPEAHPTRGSGHSPGLSNSPPSLTVSESLKTSSFWLLWFARPSLSSPARATGALS